MVYTDEVKQYVNSGFIEVLDLFGYKKDDILYKLSLCTEEERFLMEYLYSTMPLSDITNYDFELFYEYVKHAIFLRGNTAWGATIPEDIFLNYVLHYRINNEAIENCRKIFYDLLYHRLENKSIYQAVLEVNYWCAENVTYNSTDERTASPLAVLKCAYGRCGEEATFTVTALRSVGIPARQIYTPRWAHCDDNHAWVEVWCDGKWNYLGACEPEPVLGKGWFTSAASRAMVIHSRVFSSYFKNEDVISKNKAVITISNISRYADSKAFYVKVINSKSEPVEGVGVRFEILNYSEFTPIARLCTDEKGQAHINIGLGVIAIHVVKDDRFICRIVDTKVSAEIIFNIDDAVDYEEEMQGLDIDIVPPSDKMVLARYITEEEKITHKKRFEYCNTVREEKINKIVAIIEKAPYLGKYDSEIRNILLSSMGNYKSILEFLNYHHNDEELKKRINLLMCLSVKDYVDSECSVLNSHINNTTGFEANYPEEIYFKYVLCPRIYMEKITDFRKFIINYFASELKDKFIKSPRKVWNYIKECITELPEREYEELYATPAEVIKIGRGSLMSKKILFVAVCRSLGIPARINSSDLSIEYYKYCNESNGSFIKVEDKYNSVNSHILIVNSSKAKLTYYQNWTIALLENGVYRTLVLDVDILEGNKASISVASGHYRILTSNRLPNGSIFAVKYTFEVKLKETKAINIKLRNAKISDMLENYELQDFNLRDINRNVVHASDLIKDEKNIIIWIEEGKEPTEHILNEMIEMHQDYIDIKGEIIFVLRDTFAKQNKTLQRVYDLIPSIKTYFDDFSENIATIARRMYLDPDKLPLVLISNNCNNSCDITNNCINIIYACSGYSVGIGDMLIKIIKSN
ncbi:transglutaminase-like domain-containing protein [Clostridium estertheticum]|uniref:transglutaminase domain-containing protein n=1 Tax=Clostridium estertheticum TaxID=238834 RepID=UPI0013E983B6|nr:transglutaminase-like domain-containing protein [Clostridium estertheticum]MBZ9686908.1 transglutaminase-like domain-containing protein [Clostridium estertheticum]